MAEEFQFTHHSHRRFNPLTNSWVLCSPHRTQRPWQGAQESANAPPLPEFDAKCYLCPGNTRANGETNPAYNTTFAFPNDFPAVKADQPEYKEDEESAKGKLQTQKTLLCVNGVFMNSPFRPVTCNWSARTMSCHLLFTGAQLDYCRNVRARNSSRSETVDKVL